jgi:hypothetical protein
MFLISVFSAFCLFVAPLLANTSIDTIHQHHLETTEGKISFLTDKLAPYAAAAEQINHEMLDLAAQINVLSSEDHQPQITALTQEISQKMEKLLTMLPALNIALSVDADFQQLDAILQDTNTLSAEQQVVIDRIASLCNCIENF